MRHGLEWNRTHGPHLIHNEATFADGADFFHGSNKILAPYEKCDCFWGACSVSPDGTCPRAGFQWGGKGTTYGQRCCPDFMENRYFSFADVKLAYLAVYGLNQMQGYMHPRWSGRADGKTGSGNQSWWQMEVT